MQYLTIAEVLKPQGIRGEIKIKTFTDYPEDVKAFKRVYIDGKEYKILSFRVGESNFAYIGLAGVHDRDAAELLRGKLLQGDRADGPVLEEGRFYVVDVIGLACVDETGAKIGTVKDIRAIANEIYTLEDENGKEILFPVVPGVIEKIDPDNGVVIVNKKRFLEVAVI